MEDVDQIIGCMKGNHRDYGKSPQDIEERYASMVAHEKRLINATTLPKMMGFSA